MLAPYDGVATNGAPLVYAVPSTSVFRCPVRAEGLFGASPNYLNGHWSYAMNGDLRRDRKLAQVVSAAKTMLLTECGVYDADNPGRMELAFYPYEYTMPELGGPAHGGKGIPIAYVDGHAEFWRKVPPIGSSATDSSFPWTHTSFWGRFPSCIGSGQNWSAFDP